MGELLRDDFVKVMYWFYKHFCDKVNDVRR